MEQNILWKPKKFNTLLNKYIDYLKINNLHNYINYEKLHSWSIKNKKIFWKTIWNFTNIIGEYKEPIIKKEKDFINSKFFI